MTFYQELQLSSTGSKQLIRNTTDPKEKRRHILIYNFKVYLVMAFCVAVVSMYSKLTGSSNSVVGVTVLLAVLVLRQADFGIRTTHGLLSIAGIFGILMAGPRLAYRRARTTRRKARRTSAVFRRADASSSGSSSSSASTWG